LKVADHKGTEKMAFALSSTAVHKICQCVKT